MTPRVVCIVEGHGDVRAVPILIRRIAADAQIYNVDVPAPIRCPKSKILPEANEISTDELSRAIRLATLKLASATRGAILILLDADEMCPARVGPAILDMANQIRPDISVSAVLAKREYETWFVAAIDSLKGQRGIRDTAERHDSPEDLADPKRYLRKQMEQGRHYSETLDQPALTSLFDFDQARECDSFDKLLRDVRRVLANFSMNREG